MRTSRTIRQTLCATPRQPRMHRLPRGADPPGHLGDRDSVPHRTCYTAPVPVLGLPAWPSSAGTMLVDRHKANINQVVNPRPGTVRISWNTSVHGVLGLHTDTGTPTPAHRPGARTHCGEPVV